MQSPNIFERSIKPTTNNLCLLLSWYQERLLKLSRYLSARWSHDSDFAGAIVDPWMRRLIVGQQSRPWIEHPSERIESLNLLHAKDVILVLLLLVHILKGPFDSRMSILVWLYFNHGSRIYQFTCCILVKDLCCTKVWVERLILLLSEHLLLLLLMIDLVLVELLLLCTN